MPETASAGDAFQVRIIGSQDGSQTQNVLHFVAANSDADVLLHLITVLANCFVSNLLPVLSSAFTLQTINWKKVHPTLGNEVITIPAGAGAGGTVEPALPSFCSAVVSLRTGQGGRSHRGRMYLPGIPESATVGSTFDPSGDFWLGLIAFAACVLTNFTPGDPPAAGTYQWSVYSRKIGGAAFPYGASGFTPITNANPVLACATTRSRKLGHGI